MSDISRDPALTEAQEDYTAGLTDDQYLATFEDPESDDGDQDD